MRARIWLLLLVLTAGCWQPRYFLPRENVNGTGPDGSPSAVYQVRPGDAEEAVGEVRVWSAGASARFTDDDQEVVDLHVGFELENLGEDPLWLDAGSLGLEEVRIDGAAKEALDPHEIQGDLLAPPGAMTRLDLVFRPPTTYPRDIDSFSVRFVVRDAEGKGTSQLTPFVPDMRQLSYGGPTWGWGWTWGYGPYYGGYYGAYGGWGWPGGVRCR